LGITKVFSDNKIKAAHSAQFVGIFRENFRVIQNILFLMIMQKVPEGGFTSENGRGGKGTRTLKSMKTQELKEVRAEEIQ
jgi:hypothetical protein